MSINTERNECPLKGFDWLTLPRLDSLKEIKPIDAFMKQINPNSEGDIAQGDTKGSVSNSDVNKEIM